MTRIVVIEESDATRAFLMDNLAAEGFEVFEAWDFDTATAQLRTKDPQLVVADLNGHTARLLDWIDEHGIDARFFALTSEDTADNRIRLYERGAQDVMAKPFTFVELKIRLRALLGRRQSPRRMHAGPLVVDRSSRIVTANGQEVPELSSKEFALLSILAAEPTRVFTKPELLKAIWGSKLDSSTRTLDSHACRLRNKLKTAGVDGVINVWGVGYRLMDP